MNDLENLRKRAKHLVRQHRARDYQLPERIRRSLPRYAGMTDRQVLDAEFALHDAQELLAVELGFATWAELKETPPMVTTASTDLRLVSAQPQVFVRDVEQAVAYYRDVLGFDEVFKYGEPPFYAGLRRDGAGINLRHTDSSPWRDDVRDEEQLLAAAITTTDAKALFLELRDRGAEIATSLESPPWGGRHFIVRDPDGNLIHFASPT